MGVSSNSGTSAGDLEYRRDQPRWTAKVDWNIADDHVTEFTGVSDVTKCKTIGYGPDCSDLSQGLVQTSGDGNKDEAKLYAAKYTGLPSDDLTVSALYDARRSTTALHLVAMTGLALAFPPARWRATQGSFTPDAQRH